MSRILLDTDTLKSAVRMTPDRKTLILGVSFDKKVMGKTGSVNFTVEMEFENPLPPRISREIDAGTIALKNLRGEVKL